MSALESAHRVVQIEEPTLPDPSSLASLAAIASIVGQSNRALLRKNQELEAANQRERAATELALKNERTAELTPEQAAERQRHIADALQTLHEAIQAGFTNFDHMREDPDLSVLQELREFQALAPASDDKEP